MLAVAEDRVDEQIRYPERASADADTRADRAHPSSILGAVALLAVAVLRASAAVGF